MPDTILIIDDEAAIRETLSGILGDEGFTPLAAGSAEEVVFLYQEAHRTLTITCRIDPALPLFPFDAVQVKRVLINLLDNAVTALGDGGAIEVRVGPAPERETPMAMLRVADNGPGIPADVRLRIFEPYFSTRKSGTGLGLAIAHTIVSEHGGTIRCRDNQPTGTVFTVELPLYP